MQREAATKVQIDKRDCNENNCRQTSTYTFRLLTIYNHHLNRRPLAWYAQVEELCANSTFRTLSNETKTKFVFFFL